MERSLLASASLKSAGYDPVRLVLEIEFASGDVYQYENIIPRVYNEFMNAESKGGYLNKVIKRIHPGTPVYR
jgi:hypothetical protein